MDWIREHDVLLLWLGIISVVTFVGSLVLLPVLVVRMSPNYFMPGQKSALARLHPVVWFVAVVAKNLLGLLLFLSGVVMLFVPGQGLLFMTIGIVLLDFPGKRALELRLVRMPAIHKALNWIRRRYGREPLRVP